MIGADLRAGSATGRRALVEGLPLLDRRWQGKFLEQATLVGPEARGSSPVRFLRERNAGQHAGGGALSRGRRGRLCRRHHRAALDGLRAAKAIIRRYAPLERR